MQPDSGAFSTGARISATRQTKLLKKSQMCGIRLPQRTLQANKQPSEAKFTSKASQGSRPSPSAQPTDARSTGNSYNVPISTIRKGEGGPSTSRHPTRQGKMEANPKPLDALFRKCHVWPSRSLLDHREKTFPKWPPTVSGSPIKFPAKKMQYS